MTTIYVGNLPWSATEDEVRDIFSTYGKVESVKIIVDRDTGRSRGFGFVEMDEDDARGAIEQANGHELGGRALRVSEARGKASAPRGRG